MEVSKNEVYFSLVDGNDQDKGNKRRSFIEGLTVAASVLTSPLTYDSDESTASVIEEIPKTSQYARPEVVATPLTTASQGDCTDAARDLSRLQKMRRMNKPRLRVKKSPKPKSASRPYFIALMWGILLTRVWMHMWVLQLLPIPFAIYLIKLVVVWSGAWSYVQELLHGWYDKLKQWSNERQDALVPAPIRGMAKLVIRGDQKV